MNTTISRMMDRVARLCDSLHGEVFEWGGVEYVGTFAKLASALDMTQAGFSERQEYTLTAARAQFGESTPQPKQAISWRDEHWRIVADDDPQNTHDLILRVVKN